MNNKEAKFIQVLPLNIATNNIAMNYVIVISY